MWNENGPSTKHAAFYIYVVHVWFEPARVQVIRSERLNHSAMMDADMRCNYNIYFNPSWGVCGSLDPAVLWNSLDIGFKPIIGDWLRFDKEDIMEKKPQSLSPVPWGTCLQLAGKQNYPTIVENVFQLCQDVET